MSSDDRRPSAEMADDQTGSGAQAGAADVRLRHGQEHEPATMRRPEPSGLLTPRPQAPISGVVRGGAAAAPAAAPPGPPPAEGYFAAAMAQAPGAPPMATTGTLPLLNDDLPVDPTDWTLNTPAIAVRTGNFDGIPAHVLTAAEAAAAASAQSAPPAVDLATAEGSGDQDGAQLAVSRTLRRLAKQGGADVDGPKVEGPDPYLGTTIGDRYVLDDVLGEGGMGRVYLAHHKVIGKRLAVKVLHNELVKDKEALGRFLREARAASSIGNPHIVDISDFGELPDGATYFVMEFLDGATLGDLIEEKGSLPIEQVVEIAMQLCDGLSAAHAQHIVHRDLKPENVTLISKGSQKNFCKILDFGIAKVSTNVGPEKLTMAGAVFGTPHYMSPEQAAGAAVDTRTDIYSLGVMMYEMVSGQLPFNADNFMGILTQHMYKAPVPIRAIVSAPECPPGLEAIILKCLSKKPDARYQTMDELAADLQLLRSGQIPLAVQEMMARSGSFNVPVDYFKTGPAMVPATPEMPRRRGARYAWIVAAAVCVVVALVIWLRDSTGTAQTPQGAGDATAQSDGDSANVADPRGATSVVADTRTVFFAAYPLSARAKVNGKVVELPAPIEVPIGETVKVELDADGYEAQTVLLDGTEEKMTITMNRVTGPRGTWRPKQKTPPTSPKGPSDTVDPWADKGKSR